MQQSELPASSQNLGDEAKAALNKRLENIAWALFLIMIGIVWLIPDNIIPNGVGSIGIGLLLLGLNAARRYYGIKMSGFTIFLGVVALLSGIGDVFIVDLPVLPIVLILFGAYLLLRPIIEKPKGM